jgi:NAD(P)H-dependent flavin oxidoreductase YrpB (nitropropane dioxygenase family)
LRRIDLETSFVGRTGRFRRNEITRGGDARQSDWTGSQKGIKKGGQKTCCHEETCQEEAGGKEEGNEEAGGKEEGCEETGGKDKGFD